MLEEYLNFLKELKESDTKEVIDISNSASYGHSKFYKQYSVTYKDNVESKVQEKSNPKYEYFVYETDTTKEYLLFVSL